MRGYVERGGFIFAEACCGRAEFDRGFRALVRELFPDPGSRLHRGRSAPRLSDCVEEIPMGFFTYITRRKNWYDEPDANDITAQEWVRLADSDPDFERCGATCYLPPEEGLYNYRLKSPGDWEVFKYWNGSIRVSVAVIPALSKMHQVARRLGAIVQDEDGRRPYPHPQFDVYAGDSGSE